MGEDNRVEIASLGAIKVALHAMRAPKATRVRLIGCVALWILPVDEDTPATPRPLAQPRWCDMR